MISINYHERLSDESNVNVNESDSDETDLHFNQYKRKDSKQS